MLDAEISLLMCVRVGYLSSLTSEVWKRTPGINFQTVHEHSCKRSILCLKCKVRVSFFQEAIFSQVSPI